MTGDSRAQGGSRTRVLWVTEEATRDRGGLQWSFIKALQSVFDLRLQFLKPTEVPKSTSDLNDASSVQVIVFHLKYRKLFASTTGFQWGSFSGLRVMYDLDAVQNYSGIRRSRYRGSWPKVFRRMGFDHMIATGKEVARRLRVDGIPATWIAKGYDDQVFKPLGAPRSGLCHFGKAYAVRRQAVAKTIRAGIPLDRFICQYQKLNGILNLYAACLICNMESLLPGFLPQGLRARFPLGNVLSRPGLEPMAKNFEVPAAGCIPVVDAIPELSDLGFADGVNAVFYQSFDEMIEKLRKLRSTDPASLALLGAAASDLCANHHTWLHRAHAVDGMFRSLGVFPSERG